jgi:hypothetical protein
MFARALESLLLKYQQPSTAVEYRVMPPRSTAKLFSEYVAVWRRTEPL